MALYLIGAGLHDMKDLSVKAVEALKKCEKVYFEWYTSRYFSSKEEIELFLGKQVIFADRQMVEEAMPFVAEAKEKDVALVVIGDVFAATTHITLYQKARQLGVSVFVIHNASVLTAVGITGLELYKFGKVTSIPFPDKGFFPTTPYDVFAMNQAQGLHTLFLLDLRPHEQKFMTVAEALTYLLTVEREQQKGLLNEETRAIGCAHLGADDAVVKVGSMKQLLQEHFGAPPHCVIIPGKLHFVEEEMLDFWKIH